MTKKIKGHRLSHTNKVNSVSYPGLKVEDLESKVRGLLENFSPSTVILHVGTNNTKEDPNVLVSKLEHAAEVITGSSSASVTLSSIIHRRNETAPKDTELR